MRQLTSLDAQFLALEERLPLLPPFRWKLAEVPLGLDSRTSKIRSTA